MPEPPDSSKRADVPNSPPEAPQKHPLNFTLGDMPELEQFSSDAERQAALREIAKDAANLRSGSYWLAVGILVVSVLAARWLAKWGLGRVAWNFWVEEAILWAVILGTLWFVLRRLHRWGAAEELRSKLLKAGVPVCVTCGYSLRGLPLVPGRCPECGTEFDPRVAALLAEDARIEQEQSPK